MNGPDTGRDPPVGGVAPQAVGVNVRNTNSCDLRRHGFEEVFEYRGTRQSWGVGVENKPIARLSGAKSF